VLKKGRGRGVEERSKKRCQKEIGGEMSRKGRGRDVEEGLKRWCRGKVEDEMSRKSQGGSVEERSRKSQGGSVEERSRRCRGTVNEAMSIWKRGGRQLQQGLCRCLLSISMMQMIEVDERREGVVIILYGPKLSFGMLTCPKPDSS
jgi:hypothetical protein